MKQVKRSRRNKKKRILVTVLITGVLVFAGTFAGVQIVRAMGRNSLEGKTASAAPVFEEKETAPQAIPVSNAVERRAGAVTYDGKDYLYNKDIRTFLVMGIDKQGDVEEVEEGTAGGQADGLFLLVLNPHDKSVRIVAINRNAMADVDVYDENGDYRHTVTAQICTQHGFGNGVEESCEYQKKAVERFLYQLPIHGYAAINMSSVSAINDAVGGVDVTVLEDMTAWDRSLMKNARIRLMGKTAYIYTTRRDVNIPGSADGRLARQKQYLEAFTAKAVQLVKERPSALIELYNTLKQEMTTDITTDEIAYLAPKLAGYHAEGGIRTLEGETVKGESGFEEFYADEDALYRLLIEIFYEEIGEDGYTSRPEAVVRKD